MAEVAQRGVALLAEIDATETAPGTGAFWWHGQHSFTLKLGRTVLYIDPYLDPNPSRQTPPLVTPDQVQHADLVLCTHDHLDHIDPFAIPGIAAASPRSQWVAPRPHRQRMLDLGVPADRLHLLTDGESVELCGVRVTAIKAKHEFFEETAEGFPYLGYIVEANGITAYHAGDTLVYEGLFTALSRWNLDVVFLPINGRDAVRFRANCIGNMTYQEAVDLAGELKVGLAVPTHWDMFAMNSEDPQKFVDYLDAKFPGARCWVGKAGERVAFNGGT